MAAPGDPAPIGPPIPSRVDTDVLGSGVGPDTDPESS